ncbi:MAG: carbon-nitrogen hydrolase family protein [Candidatus Omnitrophica bacterium]|nr:carbon-nitrogen hydrolase family protein [Candidatus Omnitrophota bacterium]
MTMKTPDIYTGEFAELRVGLCQVETEEWAVESNFDRTLKALEEAASENAELAITPECVFQGYPIGNGPEFAQRLRYTADSIDGPRIGKVREKACEIGLNIILGFAERNGGQLHNTSIWVSSRGEIVDLYRKVHCRDFETIGVGGYYTPGEKFTVHPLRVGEQTFQIGSMICFDREIPESVRTLRALGAQLVTCPLATDTSNMSQSPDLDNEMITRCRAAENEVFIAVVNHSRRFNGGSFVVGPSGEIVCQLGPDPEVRVISLPVGGVAEKFHGNPSGWMGWGYRRKGVYLSSESEVLVRSERH